MKQNKTYLFVFVVFVILTPTILYAQDINVKIGFRDSINSCILNETRNILIHLPESYHKSNQSYPILFQLDGNDGLLMETMTVVNRLALNEQVIPELILVAIENINPGRDMWPTNTKYYPKPNEAGAEHYLTFIEKELIPFIETKYRTNGDRILYGQSMSSIFTIYSFLHKPKQFTHYIASSGAFPDCENYFSELCSEAFKQKKQYNGQKIFITNGLKDKLDPNGEMNQAMQEFSASVKNNLEAKIAIKYMSYKNEGHIPFQSLYHGLKFVFQQKMTKVE